MEISKGQAALVADLTEKPEGKARERLLELATAGYYHDPLRPRKHALFFHLLAADYDDLARKVKADAYDD